ncbi:AMP-binding protein [Spirosoma utsteinense]|uniref:Long-chain acyl-CoA synthetase n=1 Tax=Spirosoma utsteinense TaxID=2585773 RepID=A0ABR6WA88_9BACT|nr:AMP-binding protein [Spirosoma utsteinense]MBC3784034.1 long-chain acyl-CoA synthetase [Spirosoma utsteinense]MBC3793477.1 long-chain acyl-CoA synthetase [Spirosoma utsteinense]
MDTLVRMDHEPDTLIEYFYKWEQLKPDNVFLKQPVGDNFIDYTWAEAGRQARIMATYLNSLGLPPKSNIGLVSKNCAHWIIADLAILISGHVSVPFYPTLTGPQLRQVLEHSECRVLFIGKLDGWDAVKMSVPAGIQKIAFPAYIPTAPPVDTDAVQWGDILNTNKPLSGNPLPEKEDLFTIIYTSGTTGNPKGVMITYDAVTAVMGKTQEQMRYDVIEARFFSYLPLCHIAERNVVEATGIGMGGTIYFAESLDTFARNLAVARPTHFLAVPRIWTKFQLGILAKIPQSKLDTLMKIPVVSSLIKRKIRQGLGLNDARLIITGAAPMPISLIQWFRRLGIIIQEAYGMTENLGAVSMMPADKLKDGTVGRVNEGMEIRTDPQTGEVQTKSRWNMLGYYREPELTAATIREGWLYTGDVGEVDREGFLRITGRVKEMYKSPKGEYIAPSQIEFGFADNNHIEQVCVTGQQLPQPIALIVLSETARQTDRQTVAQGLQQTLDALNERVHNYERVRKLIVMKEPWTVENDLMTPTMKMKRNVIDARYGTRYEPWFGREEVIVWED